MKFSWALRLAGRWFLAFPTAGFLLAAPIPEPAILTAPPSTNVYGLPVIFTPSTSIGVTGYTLAWGTVPDFTLAQRSTNVSASVTNVIGPLSRTNHYWVWAQALANTPPSLLSVSQPLAWEPPITNWVITTGEQSADLVNWSPLSGSLPIVEVNPTSPKVFTRLAVVQTNNQGTIRAKERPWPP